MPHWNREIRRFGGHNIGRRSTYGLLLPVNGARAGHERQVLPIHVITSQQRINQYVTARLASRTRHSHATLPRLPRSTTLMVRVVGRRLNSLSLIEYNNGESGYRYGMADRRRQYSLVGAAGVGSSQQLRRQQPTDIVAAASANGKY